MINFTPSVFCIKNIYEKRNYVLIAYYRLQTTHYWLRFVSNQYVRVQARKKKQILIFDLGE